MIPFLPDAQHEFDAAIGWYEDERKGLGLEFLNQVLRDVEQIELNPYAAPLLESGIRRFLVRRFPFGLVYRCDPPIVIVAVMHLRRDPDYWKTRV